MEGYKIEEEMKTIKYKDWLKKAKEARKASAEILVYFDVAKLKRKPKDPEEKRWLEKRGLGSKFTVTR